MAEAGASARRPRLLTFRSGGWILLLSLLLAIAGVGLRLREMSASRGRHAVGDGRRPETYGFDLSDLAVPRAPLVGSGLSRDGIPVLDFPAIWPAARVDTLLRAGRNKYLVPSDRVIGVERNGRTRAYPLIVLNWHEVVNDTLGGVPIVVTYAPLCDAAAVYDRRLPADAVARAGASILFGHSGLLYNSDPLLYDRRAEHRGESLWIQLTGRAIAGPAGLGALVPLPCALVRWADWKERHPGTTVLARDESRKDRYKREPYTSYLGNDLLRYPVDPLPDTKRMPLKTPCVIVSDGSPRPGRADAEEAARVLVLPLPWIAKRTGPEGVWITRWAESSLIFRYSNHPPTVQVEAADSSRPVAVRYAFWFAWYAMAAGKVEVGEEGGAEGSVHLKGSVGQSEDP